VTTPVAEVGEPTPVPAGFGLYSVAQLADPTDRHTQAGVSWEPTICGVATPFPINCPEDYTLPFRDGMDYVETRPFGIAAGIRCKLVGTTIGDMRDAAREQLRLTESRAVEVGYLHGEVLPEDSPSPYLRNVPEDNILGGGAAVSAATGLGLLEEALGNMTGALGIIHAPRRSIGTLGAQVVADGGRMATKLGTLVAFGSGYNGAAPGGDVPVAAAWLYATGPVQVTRGPVIDIPAEDREVLNRENNEATVWAARIVSVGHSCGTYAVQITLV
jgi:hypothetical protein